MIHDATTLAESMETFPISPMKHRFNLARNEPSLRALDKPTVEWPTPEWKDIQASSEFFELILAESARKLESDKLKFIIEGGSLGLKLDPSYIVSTPSALDAGHRFSSEGFFSTGEALSYRKPKPKEVTLSDKPETQIESDWI